MTPTSDMIYFWSGCQVEGLWCEPHHGAHLNFQAASRIVLSELTVKVPCLVWFYVHGIPFGVDCSARKRCCSPCSIFLQSLPMLIAGNAGGVQPSSSSFFISVSSVSAGGVRKTAPREGRSEALLGGERTFICMKTLYFFF